MKSSFPRVSRNAVKPVARVVGSRTTAVAKPPVTPKTSASVAQPRVSVAAAKLAATTTPAAVNSTLLSPLAVGAIRNETGMH